jgi:magnesium transporter
MMPEEFSSQENDSSQKVQISLFIYSEDNIVEQQFDNVEELLQMPLQYNNVWINIDGIDEPLVIQKIAEHFKLHPLLVEDIVQPEQRPKYEEFEDYADLVLKMIYLTNDKSAIIPEQVSFVFSANYLLTFQEGPTGDVFQVVRERLRQNRGKIRKMGIEYLMYSLLDIIVDHYFLVLEEVGERIEEIENQLMEDSSRKTSDNIYLLKRDLLYLRKHIFPLQEVIRDLSKAQESCKLYFQDVYDHVTEILDLIAHFQTMLNSMLDIFSNNLTQKMNEIMKVLTMISTIFIPLTFMAGIYGMNFKHMPELEYPYAYPLLIVLMLLVSGFFLLFFKRKKWFLK